MAARDSCDALARKLRGEPFAFCIRHSQAHRAKHGLIGCGDAVRVVRPSSCNKEPMASRHRCDCIGSWNEPIDPFAVSPGWRHVNVIHLQAFARRHVNVEMDETIDRTVAPLRAPTVANRPPL